MESNKDNPNFVIKIANDADLFDLNLCAKDFLDLLDDFKGKFLNKKYFILAAYSNNILAGILVAEDRCQKVDSLEKIIPNICVYLVYVNNKFRNKQIAKGLLESFIKIQKGNGIASIYVELPQKYKNGIKFFQKNNFIIINKEKSKIILELNLWNDYGIKEWQIINDDFDTIFP